MTYDWEKTFVVVGVATANTDTGEGAFKLSGEVPNDPLLYADILKDVLGDVQRLYDEAREQAFGA